MIVLDRTTTGDGLIAALQVLAAIKRTGRTLSELAADMPKYPQTMRNVRISARMEPDEIPEIRAAVVEAEERLRDTGRIVLRPSGTEPVIRVMVEGRDDKLVAELAERLAAVVSATAG
jgi:phosphoglucosamine mutase